MHPHVRLSLILTAFTAAGFMLVWPWVSDSILVGRPTEQGRTSAASPDSASSSLAVRISIPTLGIDAPIVESGGRTEQEYQRALQNGVVHFPGTASPGKPGNAYYFGHSSDYFWSPGDFKTVFEKLPSIREGAEITVTNASGTDFVYVVTGTKVVKPNDLTVLSQGDRTKALLTLQTSYPVGTALRRFIVQAELAPWNPKP